MTTKKITKKATKAKRTTKVVQEPVLPGVESEAVRSTLQLFTMFLTAKQLEFVNGELSIKADAVNGVLRSNFKKVLSYVTELSGLKTSSVNKKIPASRDAAEQKLAALDPRDSVTGLQPRLPVATKTERTRKGLPEDFIQKQDHVRNVIRDLFDLETSNLVETSVPLSAQPTATFKAVGVPGKGAAPGTKNSFVVSEEAAPALVIGRSRASTATRARAPKADISTDLLEKLGKSELERFKKLPINKAFPHVRIVSVQSGTEVHKVVVLGTATGYKVSNLYNINCKVNDRLITLPENTLMHKEESGRNCLYSDKQVVPGKPELEERYIRLFKYQEGMRIQYWLHNKTRKCDEERKFLEIAGDKVIQSTGSTIGE